MNRPVGVVVIAILYWLGAFWLLLLGAVLAIGSTIFGASMTGIPPIISGLGVAGGIFMLAFGAALGFIGYGLMTLREWARMTVTVLAVVGIVFGVLGGIGIFGRLIRVAMNVVIVWYLTQPKIKAVFR